MTDDYSDNERFEQRPKTLPRVARNDQSRRRFTPESPRLRHSDYKVPCDRINVARVQLNLERASTFIHLTRSNICDSPSLCGFTGASTIAGTCDPLKGAAIINDVGLHTGYHIAHHIGHTYESHSSSSPLLPFIPLAPASTAARECESLRNTKNMKSVAWYRFH